MKTDMNADAAPQSLKATEASPAWLSSPTVFAVNREPAHSDHPYHDHMPHPGETSTLRQSLGGDWLVTVAAVEQGERGFPLNPSGSAVPDFAAPAYDDGTMIGRGSAICLPTIGATGVSMGLSTTSQPRP